MNPNVYMNTTKKAKGIVKKMLDVKTQIKETTTKMFSTYKFMSKLAKHEAVGHSGPVTAFYNGSYNIRIKLNSNLETNKQINIEKLREDILQAVDEARTNNHIHKYYETILFKHSNTDQESKLFNKDFTLAQDDDENSIMFKQVLKKWQSIDFETNKKLKEHLIYLKNNNSATDNVHPEFFNFINNADLSEETKTTLTNEEKEKAIKLSEEFSDLLEEDVEPITEYAYDYRMDPDAAPLAPYLDDLIRLKAFEKDVEQYEKENGEGSFEKYIKGEVTEKLTESYTALESLNLGSDETRDNLLRMLFDTKLSESIGDIMASLDGKSQPTTEQQLSAKEEETTEVNSEEETKTETEEKKEE
ncbi:hypothetical protein ABK040_002580 [Willaertia magna]